jgi:outer membrane immunogenic protein
MKRILSSTIAIAALLGLAGAASAADMGARPMPTKAPAYVAPYYNWTGAYIGINGGGGWGSSNNIDSSGGFVGGTLGYNWQQGQAVFGIETDLAWSGIDGSGFIGAVPVTAGSDWFGTVRGRIGYAWDRTMLFASGGLAYGNVNARSPFSSVDTTNAGWALGGGVEFALAGPWTAKVEYLHIDLGTANLLTPGTTSVDYSADLVRAGLNYRF